MRDGRPRSISHHLDHMICSQARKLGFFPHAFDGERSVAGSGRRPEQLSRFGEITTHHRIYSDSRPTQVHILTSRGKTFNALNNDNVSQFGADGNVFTLTARLRLIYNSEASTRFDASSSIVNECGQGRSIKIRRGSEQDSAAPCPFRGAPPGGKRRSQKGGTTRCTIDEGVSCDGIQ